MRGIAVARERIVDVAKIIKGTRRKKMPMRRINERIDGPEIWDRNNYPRAVFAHAIHLFECGGKRIQVLKHTVRENDINASFVKRPRKCVKVVDDISGGKRKRVNTNGARKFCTATSQMEHPSPAEDILFSYPVFRINLLDDTSLHTDNDITKERPSGEGLSARPYSSASAERLEGPRSACRASAFAGGGRKRSGIANAIFHATIETMKTVTMSICVFMTPPPVS